MISGHGANPIFFNKKKDWTSRTLATLHPPTFNNISVLPYPLPLPPSPNLQSRRQMRIAPSTSNCAVCLLSPRNFLMLGGLDISKYYLGRTSNCQELHTRVQDSKK